MDTPTRSADCYVFCLYAETNRDCADILDIPAWRFYVVASGQIERELGDQKTVGLSRIQSLSSPVGYHELQRCIRTVLGLPNGPSAAVGPPTITCRNHSHLLSDKSDSSDKILGFFSK